MNYFMWLCFIIFDGLFGGFENIFSEGFGDLVKTVAWPLYACGPLQSRSIRSPQQSILLLARWLVLTLTRSQLRRNQTSAVRWRWAADRKKNIKSLDRAKRLQRVARVITMFVAPRSCFRARELVVTRYILCNFGPMSTVSRCSV